MNYLFFDIECANCFEGTGKICEFGYVLTDDQFTILEQDSIKMNPCDRFDVKGFAIRGIRLEKPYEYYKTQPNFKNFYDRIKTLLQQPKQINVGHGVENDARYLIDECNRYKLQPINFEFCDTCELAKLIYNRDKRLRLKEVYEDLCGINDVDQKHRSLDDSLMTMEITKYYAQELKMPLYQIMSNYSLATGESFCGRVVKAGIPNLLYSYTGNGTKNRQFINTFIEEELNYNADKTYVLSSEFMHKNFVSVLVILNRLKEIKAQFSLEMKNGVTYVLNEEKNRKLERYEKYLAHKNIDVKIRKISLDDFLSEIGLTRQDLMITRQEADELAGNIKRNKGWYDYYKKTHSQFYHINNELVDGQFECSVDFPVIQYVANITVDVNGESQQKRFFLFYDYVLDDFYNMHPYRVNRAVNSYLDQGFFDKAKEKSYDRIKYELARKFIIPTGGRIKAINIEKEYPYITSYKFKGKFLKDNIVFDFPSRILSDDDFKCASKGELASIKLNIEQAIKELYNEKSLSKALCHMSKFKFGYKDKAFKDPTISNKKYKEGDEMFLPKEYYQLSIAGELNSSYLPSAIEMATEIFKKKLQLPVLIRRK